MYYDHFGFQSPPFSISPDPRFLYLSERHRDALAHLIYGAGENGGFVLLTGQVGTGKTTLIRSLISKELSNIDIALCLHSGLSVIDFVSSILDELNIQYAPNPASLKPLVDALNMHLLRAHAAGRQTVLIIDEGQNLSREVLEQVRLLTNLETDNQKLLRIILVGQEELQAITNRSDLRQLSQRITGRYHLTALNPVEVGDYIFHRVKIANGSPTIFTASAIKKVAQYSGGVPRLINVICDRALLVAYNLDTHRISAKHIKVAASEVLPTNRKQRYSTKSYSTAHRSWIAPLSLMLLLGVAYGGYHYFDKSIKLNSFSEWSIFDVSRETVPYQKKQITIDERDPVSVTELQQKPTGIISDEGVDNFVDKLGSEKQSNQSSEVAEIVNSPQSPASLSSALSEGLVSDDFEQHTNVNSAVDNSVANQAKFTPAHVSDVTINEGLPATPSLGEPQRLTPESSEKIAQVLSSDLSATTTGTGENVLQQPPESLFTANSDDEAVKTDASVDKYSVNQSDAILQLLKRWELSDDLVGTQKACDLVASQEMLCLTIQGSLPLIYQINRPVLLEVQSDDEKQWLPVVGVNSEQQFICLADNIPELCDSLEVVNRWTGSMLVLLRQPSVNIQIRPGFEGEQILWLRQRIAIAENRNVSDISQSLVFDEALVEKVKVFQRSRYIDDDGIIGKQTLMYLHNVVADETTPLLQARN